MSAVCKTIKTKALQGIFTGGTEKIKDGTKLANKEQVIKRCSIMAVLEFGVSSLCTDGSLAALLGSSPASTSVFIMLGLIEARLSLNKHNQQNGHKIKMMIPSYGTV
jgi:L-2-hydroxyglutarate oxidase LhgO